MSQSDLNIANVSRSLFRQEANEALQALGSLSSGATEPTTTYAYQLWADTGSGVLKQRNAANDGWINKGNLADVDWGFLNKAGGTMTGLLNLAAGADIASASNVDLTAATGNCPKITGTTPVTAWTMNTGQQMKCIAGDALPLTYHATTNNIEGGASYTCEAGDIINLVKGLDGVVRVRIHKQDGTPVVPTTFASSAENAAGIVEGKSVDPLGIREAFNATGSAPVYACRAWVNFDGTGTVAIRASGNVSSITDNGAGRYSVSFTTAMPDANYAVSLTLNQSEAQGSVIGASSYNTDGFLVTASRLGTSAQRVQDTDYSLISVAVFR